MFVARDPAGTAIAAQPGVDAICPLCHEPVRPKCGQIVSWHFAHHAREDCDPWSEGETDWHRDWKEAVPIQRREVVIGPHRADIVAENGTVVELQHSPISRGEIIARERFYRRIAWVFDVAEPYDEGRLTLKRGPRNQGPDDPFRTFTWKHCRTSLAACWRPIYFDFGDEYLLRVRVLDHRYRFWGGYGRLGTRAEFVAWLNGHPS